MAQEQGISESSKLPSFDTYWEIIQSRKKLPHSLQESLTASFAMIPVSSFPNVPGGKVIEIPADTRVIDAVKILAGNNILSAPVRNPDAEGSMDWKDRYLGIIDYSAIILWLLQNAELAAVALSTGSSTAAGVGAGALGAIAMGTTGPIAIAGLTVAALSAAVVGGIAADKGVGKDAQTAAGSLGEDFYQVLLNEEPFKSTTVKEIIKSYRCSTFFPVAEDSSMLSVLLLLSKYRLRNVPVMEAGKPHIKNFITQSGVVQGLERCKGRDWFDAIASCPISDLGLPFMSANEVISVNKDELILEAFIRMKENHIGGLPVVEGPEKKIIGDIGIKDIRFLLLKPDIFSNFRQITVMDFINTIATVTEASRKPAPPARCQLDSSLGSIIKSLALRQTHRVHVAGEEGNVVGVVTLRDVISCFIHEPPNYFFNHPGDSVKFLYE